MTTIVCLLDKYELRSIGVSGDYRVQVEANGLDFGPQYPIIEMAAPPSLPSLHDLVRNDAMFVLPLHKRQMSALGLFLRLLLPMASVSGPLERYLGLGLLLRL